MKGIILAGGFATRLYPMTRVVSKQLLPIYNKPMIYYPLSILMLTDIREICIISTPNDMPRFKELLSDGRQWGLSFSYIEQPYPQGIAQAFILAQDFIKNDNVCLILGDNIFYGYGLQKKLQEAASRKEGATVFGYRVHDPERYGVITLNEQGLAVDIEEKPTKPKSNYAVTGLYFYDNRVIDLAAGLKPSSRGELEITDINRLYLQMNALNVITLSRGYAWLDTGTPESLLEAGLYIETIEKRQGLKVACVEEIAFRMGYIEAEQVRRLAEPMIKNEYGQYLMEMIKHSSL
jgi:glucose-1-phosphate thymidylyltransferase